MLLGAHTSISGGLYKSLERGQEIGCETVQIFSKNQQQWASKPLNEADVESFHSAKSETGITRFFIHDSYLINLAHHDDEKWQKSINAFIDELERAERLGAEALIFHPGSTLKKMTDDEGCDRVADALNICLDAFDCACKPAIENTAGQGSNLGWRFEHTARILDAVNEPERVGTCFDTCHAFAAGYDLRTEADYDATFNEYDDVIGLDKLLTFHINDSKVELSRRVDRHENLGHGHIGEECFRCLVNDDRFADRLGALETPMESNGGHARDLELLRSFVN